MIIRNFLSAVRWVLPAVMSLASASAAVPEAKPDLNLPAGTAATGRSATGAIKGRVANPANGTFIEQARVTVEGTSLETFTDAAGYYRLNNLPVGNVRVKVFYTGLVPHLATVGITAGSTATHDVVLGAPGRRGAAVTGEVVKLDEFVVTASTEMEGAAIAIHEQRFAPNQKTVVATDEFGFVPEGNIGEFMKFLPGVTVETNGGYARSISVDGVSADYVPVTVSGFSLASAFQGGGTTRQVSADNVSINNLSRIEVSFSPTPDTQASALAGAVELVPRSAFERSRPKFDYTVYYEMRDNARDFRPTPGPGKDPEAKANPGFDFVYILPVNRRFGLTLSGGYSKTYSDQEQIDTTWRGVRTATNGTTFPNTTSDRPYLTSLYDRTNPKMMRRTGASLTFDYKLSDSDQVSFNLVYARNYLVQMAHTITFNVTQVPAGQFALDWTHGAVGQGNATIDNIASFNDNHTYMPTMTWRHRGLNWEANAGLAHSQAEAYSYGGPGGAFRTALAQRQGITLWFDGFNGQRPASITATDGITGAAVDLHNINSYVLRSAGDNLVRSSDVKRTAYLNVTRRYGTEVPFSVKGGLDIRQALRGQRNSSLTLSYVGGDGRASTSPVSGDDQASSFLDAGNSLRSAPFGFPRWQRLSVYKLWDHWRANPGQFTRDENTDYRNAITNSKRTEEIVSAAYLRVDTAVLSSRLRFTGGLRAEQVNITAEGPLTDPTGNYQRNARGEVILGSNGRPLPIASDALTISKLTYLDRGTLAKKEYLRLFPSLNGSFNVRENLVLRGAHYHSIGRPNFNQYSGGLTLPDIESAPSASNRISVNNAGIKPWTARSTSARLEYYFAAVGQVSISGFVRDFRNFFGSTATPATPAFLALYGLDPAIYGGYDVATQQNIGSGLRMSGWTLSYKQALTFLPSWARGMQVFANGTEQRLEGDDSAKGNLQTFYPRTASWGASLNRQSFNLRTTFSYRGKRRNALITGASIDPGTYNWNQSKLQIDVLGEYRLTRQLSVFANMRNVNTALDEDIQNYGPRTPAFAKVQHLGDLGALWTIGVKGSF